MKERDGFDAIRKWGPTLPDWLSDAEIIDIRSLFNGMEGQDHPWLSDTSTLPRVTPPYERLLLVGPLPVCMVTVEITDDRWPHFSSAIDAWSREAGGLKAHESESQQWSWPDLPPGTRWVSMIGAIDWTGQGWVAFEILPIRDDGHSLGISALLSVNNYENNENGEIESALSGASRLALFAISLTHCKNVEMVDEEEHVSRQVRRHKERRGEPLLTYKVLKVRPSKSGRSAATESGELTALHTCRGHFKTYTDEAPLFGHITGTYWWSDHVRGSIKAGAVVKDYEVA